MTKHILFFAVGFLLFASNSFATSAETRKCMSKMRVYALAEANCAVAFEKMNNAKDSNWQQINSELRSACEVRNEKQSAAENCIDGLQQ